MKKAIYFPVTTNNYATPKSLDIRMNFGWGGYGIYFALLQKLAATKSRTFKISEANALAFDLHCTQAELMPIIRNYFDLDDTIFCSQELNEWLSYYDEKYNKASEGGKKAAAGMTPEELSERGKKAIKTRWEKAQNKKDDDLKKEVEEQVQTEIFEENQHNELQQSTASKSDSTSSDTLGKNGKYNDNTYSLVSEYQPVSIGLVSDTNNRNRNIKEIEIEKKENINGNKIKIENKAEELSEDSVFDSTDFKPSKNFDYSVLIDNDQLLRSVYFGRELNEKLLKEYFNTPNELKSKLIYLQFEKIFLYILLIKLGIKHNSIKRQTVIDLLNSDFDSNYKIVAKSIDEKNIQHFLENEDNITKIQLNDYKL